MKKLLIPLLSVLAATAAAEDWRGFRGPQGNGRSGEDQAPTKWSAEENIAWKAELPQPGNGSAIVVEGHVLVTSAEDPAGRQRSLYCFDRKSGDLQWKQTVEYDKEMPTHKTNPYCGSTPAADGGRVVVWHGSAGLYCYDLEGKELWKRELGEYRHIWGYGTSPVIIGDRVLMHCGPGKEVQMAALSLEDGSTIWQQSEAIKGDGSRNEAGKYMGSWSTPVVVRRDDKLQAVCAMSTRVVSYDVETGDILWFCMGVSGPKGDLAYSSPMVSDTHCVYRGGFGGPSLGFKLGGQGDITSNRIWRKERNPQNIGTGLLIGDYYYMANANPGSIQCLRVATGEEAWEERSPGGNVWGSMVLVGDVAYLTNQKGQTVLFRPNPTEFDLLQVNSLNDASNATPAVTDGQLFIRGAKFLWCVGA